MALRLHLWAKNFDVVVQNNKSDTSPRCTISFLRIPLEEVDRFVIT